jgi:hypothetical protein
MATRQSKTCRDGGTVPGSPSAARRPSGVLADVPQSDLALCCPGRRQGHTQEAGWSLLWMPPRGRWLICHVRTSFPSCSTSGPGVPGQ